MISKKATIFAALTVASVHFTSFGTDAVEARATKTSKAPPIDLTISNSGCFKGIGIEPYIQKAVAQRQLAAQQGNAGELASFFVSVPSRPWRGLTVSGVGLHYETTSVYFREKTQRVRSVLRAAGIVIEVNDVIPITNEEAVEIQTLQTTTGEARRYGASEIRCGI
jgi:hypothetical protein